MKNNHKRFLSWSTAQNNNDKWNSGVDGGARGKWTKGEKEPLKEFMAMKQKSPND